MGTRARATQVEATSTGVATTSNAEAQEARITKKPRQDRRLRPSEAAQIRRARLALRREPIARTILPLLTKLYFHRSNYHGIFNTPVDPVAFKIPHYFDVITHPMDLGTVRKQLLNLEYDSVEACANDMRLVFQNAMTFNPPGHLVYQEAKILRDEFEKEYKKLCTRVRVKAQKRQDHSCPQCLSNICGLCNEKCINFEPPLVICCGPCEQKIRRQATFYMTPDRAYNWCTKCYAVLPRSFEVEGENSVKTTVQKNTILRSKFTDELTEPWVQCDRCFGWVHQICAMFNAKQDEAEGGTQPYVCPLCLLRDYEETEMDSLQKSPTAVSTEVNKFTEPRSACDEGISHSPVEKKKSFLTFFVRKPFQFHFFETPSSSSASPCPASFKSNRSVSPLSMPTLGAWNHALSSDTLPSFNISLFIQEWVRQCLFQLGEKEAANSIVVKLASSLKVKAPLSKELLKTFPEYPETIEYTAKNLVVFQKMDGVEVCVFSMYVQEYGAECNYAPNRNRVYIAYIDSLSYVQPRHIRTQLFQETLISYMAYCKMRGFTYAHIWACPTSRGGDFIYWCHPAFQKNPGKERLLAWYDSMIKKAIKAKVVYGKTDMYTKYFAHMDPASDTDVAIPYFDGGFWPCEFNRIVNAPQKRGRQPKPDPLTASEDPEVTKRRKYRQKLVTSVRGTKDSLFVIPLQPTCSCCENLIVNDRFWYQSGNDSLLLCDACSKEETERCVKIEAPSFISSIQQKHEGDDYISCPFLDKRTSMLNNCEEKHYQFDTLRRAKYSTMMLVYHMKTESKLIPN